MQGSRSNDVINFFISLTALVPQLNFGVSVLFCCANLGLGWLEASLFAIVAKPSPESEASVPDIKQTEVRGQDSQAPDSSVTGRGRGGDLHGSEASHPNGIYDL